MTLDERIDLFAGELLCGNRIYVWQYNAQGQLLSSNCPDEAVLGSVFQVFGCKEELYRRAESAKGPVYLESPLGDTWFGDYIREDGAIRRAVVIGPLLYGGVSLSQTERIARDYCQDHGLAVSLVTQREMIHALSRTGYVIPTVMNQFALSLHYILTGEQLGISGIELSDMAFPEPEYRDILKKNRNEVWQTELGLMRMVREGDLNYKQALDNSVAVSNGLGISSGSGLRKAKYSVIVFISLCVRAAMEGGLSPEVAYSLGDSYIQAVDDASSVREISAISMTMYQDFIQRVHNCRFNPNYSKPIQIAVDYIEQNAEGDLSIGAIAARVGYSEYYLSRKFKEEVHTSINTYIKIVKVDRAKFLLGCTTDSVQDISDRLHFCSRSYFGDVFRRIVGCSPVEYRQNYKKG